MAIVFPFTLALCYALLAISLVMNTVGSIDWIAILMGHTGGYNNPSRVVCREWAIYRCVETKAWFLFCAVDT